MTHAAMRGSAAITVWSKLVLSGLLTLDAQLIVGHSWWALRYVSHPASAGLFLSLRHLAVEHGNLVFQRDGAGANVAGHRCVSGEDG